MVTEVKPFRPRQRPPKRGGLSVGIQNNEEAQRVLRIALGLVKGIRQLQIPQIHEYDIPRDPLGR